MEKEGLLCPIMLEILSLWYAASHK